jgi:hypothetical protein
MGRKLSCVIKEGYGSLFISSLLCIGKHKCMCLYVLRKQYLGKNEQAQKSDLLILASPACLFKTTRNLTGN